MIELKLDIKAKNYDELQSIMKNMADTVADQYQLYHCMNKLGYFPVQSSGINMKIDLPPGSIPEPLSLELVHLIKSFVGLNSNPDQQKEFYRNRFCTTSETRDWPSVEYLIKKGLVVEYYREGRAMHFKLTDIGLREARKYAKYKDTFPEQPKEID